MIVCGPQPDRHLEKPPELVVEVLSPSTRTQDQVTKLQLYHEHRVPFYLIIDAEAQRIDVYKFGTDGYDPASHSERIDLPLPSGCHFDVAASRVLR